MIQQIFRIDTNYPDDLQRQRAYVILSFIGVGLVAYFVYAFFIPSNLYAPDTLYGYMSRTGKTLNVILIFAFFVFALLTLVMIRMGNLRWASWVAFLALCMVTIGTTYNTGLFDGFNTALAVITVFLGGLIVGRGGLLIATLITFATAVFSIIFRSSLTPDTLPDYIASVEALTRNSLSDLASLTLMIFGLAIITNEFLRSASAERRAGADEAVQAQLYIAQIVTELTRQTTRRVSVAELSNYTIERILVDFFKIYHAQIFLTDENGTEARLFASTGAVGKKLIERAHGLKIGSVSVIGQVTYLGKYIIAKSGSRDTVHQRNELLPETQVEAAFPLRIGDRVIGALDLQSKERDTFDREDLAQAFQTLADSIGLAIDNIRQYDRAEQRLQENQRLVEETREALRQVERLNQRLTGRIWTDYIGGAGYEIGASVDFEADKKLTQAELTASLKEAIENQQLVQTTTDEGRQIITVPLRVRGRVVGAMEFELDEDDPFTPDDLDLLNEVSDRFGVAVENVRLVNESQRTAQREALVNQIVGRLQTMNNVEDMVTEAAKGLRDALKANKIAIKLGTPPR